MKISKNLSIIPLITLTLICANGCSNTNANRNYDNDSVLVDEANTMALDAIDEKFDGPDYTGNLQITGSTVIWDYESPSASDHKGICEMSVTSGKAKLIFIDAQNKITTLIECDATSNNGQPIAITLPVSTGNNRIKLVGKNKAEVHLSLDLEVGEAHSASF
jgi:hypothetical protein